MKNHSLTQGSIAKGLLFFVIPLFFSNLFQQLYNTIDTLTLQYNRYIISWSFLRRQCPGRNGCYCRYL